MSTTEQRAHEIYERYNLGALPNDVRDQVIILMLNNRCHNYAIPEEDSENSMVAEECPPRLSVGQLHERIDLSRKQISDGQARPVEEFFDEMDANFPWLCK